MPSTAVIILPYDGWTNRTCRVYAGGGLHPAQELSALHGTRQWFQDPLAASLPHADIPARTELLHGQSILELLRTRPLTAPGAHLSGGWWQLSEPKAAVRW